jgi:hypothetical protein
MRDREAERRIWLAKDDRRRLARRHRDVLLKAKRINERLAKMDKKIAKLERAYLKTTEKRHE